MDIIIHPLAFGGRAFEPVSAAGKTWAADIVGRNLDYPIFRVPDGCMTGFGVDDFGVEPCDFAAFFEDLCAAGLTASHI